MRARALSASATSRTSTPPSLAKRSIPPTRALCLVGGVTIALALAAAHPEFVSAAVLLDPPPPGTAAMTRDEVDLAGAAPYGRTSARRAAGPRPRANPGVSRERRRLDVGKTPQLVPGSCVTWMLGHDRAGVAEAAWGETLGDRLVGTQHLFVAVEPGAASYWIDLAPGKSWSGQKTLSPI